MARREKNICEGLFYRIEVTGLMLQYGILEGKGTVASNVNSQATLYGRQLDQSIRKAHD
jgi:hypothetical protein